MKSSTIAPPPPPPEILIIPDIRIDNNSESGRTVSMVVRSGIPIQVPTPIPGCPEGLEPLTGQKNFYFEEIKLGFLERDHDHRFSYNVYTGDGSRIYFIANSSRLTSVPSSRYYTYEVLGNTATGTGEPIMTWEGDQYGGCSDVCCFCCACNGRRGIRLKYKDVEIGRFFPVHRKVMPWIFSCANCCFCYIDKYVVEFTEDDPSDKSRVLVTRKPTRSAKKKDSGLEVIDPADGSLVARITNCVLSGIKKSRVLPADLQKSDLVGSEVKVQFSLSLSDAYVEELHPNGTATLLALAMFHESEVMKSQRGVTKDHIGFLLA